MWYLYYWKTVQKYFHWMFLWPTALSTCSICYRFVSLNLPNSRRWAGKWSCSFYRQVNPDQKINSWVCLTVIGLICRTCPFGRDGLHFGNECLSLFPAVYGVPFPTDEPTDIIPRSCQLARDVPHVTLLLNMTKLRQTEIKFGGHPLSSAESGTYTDIHTVSIIWRHLSKEGATPHFSVSLALTQSWPNTLQWNENSGHYWSQEDKVNE